MEFKEHSEIRLDHALFSPSKYYWINYTDDELVEYVRNAKAVEIGVRKHAFAAEAISLGYKLAKTKDSVTMHVNDAIGFKMMPEVKLVYSENVFGTADAIAFRDHTLRIHDLKTGKSPTHMEQLMIYAALFYLEYQNMKEGDDVVGDPFHNSTILRIYQTGEILEYKPEPDEIMKYMNKIISCDKAARKIMREGL
jgi:hypothetical protein